MRLIPLSLMPREDRAPFFDGWDTTAAVYYFDCSQCGAPVKVPFTTMHHGAWGWKERFSPSDVASIQELFGLTNRCKAFEGGWPSVSDTTCGACGAHHVFYADFDEYRNSVYRIVAQGLAHAA